MDDSAAKEELEGFVDSSAQFHTSASSSQQPQHHEQDGGYGGEVQHGSERYRNGSSSSLYDIHRELSIFWPRVKAKVEALDHTTLREANRHQELPLARIKKIMKLDDDVKPQMISAEAPVLLAKAAELFIEELTLRSWLHTEESKRKTLQKSDVSQAVSRYEQFDFLIDIVPRDETRRTNPAGIHLGGGAMEAEMIDGMQHGGNALGGNVHFVLQVGASDGALTSGSMVHATPIGQPIQLPASNGGQPIQLIALGLPDGGVQQFQVELPTST